MCGVQTRYVCVYTRWCVRLVTGDRTEAGGECVLVYVCIRTDLILTISAHWPLSGRQIFEDFRALRAQANFDSNFGKSLFTPISRALRPFAAAPVAAVAAAATAGAAAPGAAASHNVSRSMTAATRFFAFDRKEHLKCTKAPDVYHLTTVRSVSWL